MPNSVQPNYENKCTIRIDKCIYVSSYGIKEFNDRDYEGTKAVQMIPAALNSLLILNSASLTFSRRSAFSSSGATPKKIGKACSWSVVRPASVS